MIKKERQESTIIVFSKDRPMQLHAYLESLKKATGCNETDIYVLFKEISPICYDKVREYFPNVNWIPEKHFAKQLYDIVLKAKDYIMFGCDDVVFVNDFDLHKAEVCLKENVDVFGFSFRLGRNIKPIPRKLWKNQDIYLWDWAENTGHYGYPWELDCTLYRKEDVIAILSKIGDVKSPNYLESIPEEKPNEYILRRKMAAYYEDSKAIVITVNRVQDTHPNSIDALKLTDVLSLFIQYQYEDRYLDIDRLWKCKHQLVHVGSGYFQLTSGSVAHQVTGNNSWIGKWKYLVQNLRFLGSGNLEERLRNSIEDSIVCTRLCSMTVFANKSKVLGPEETVRILAEQPKSFCRFGDGEFSLMSGNSIAFQRYNPELSLSLWEIFCSNDEKSYIGIPYQQFEMPDNFNEWIQKFYYSSGAQVRKFLCRYLPCNREVYLDTGFNQVYQTYRRKNFAAYYEQVKRLFQDKKITIISGEGVLDKLSYNVFQYASSIEYLYGPKENAYDKYSEILRAALNIDKQRIICVILGPTSKLLVRDLAEEGYIAWDVGHLAKDYDAFCKRVERNTYEIKQFYAPD